VSLYPQPIQKLIDHFADLPGVGRRAGTRYVFYLLQESKKDLSDFAEGLESLKKEITLCDECLNVAKKKKEESLCEICSDQSRKKNQIMVVEKISDIESIEKAKAYGGLYHVLGNTLPVKSQSKNKKTGSISLDKLLQRLKEKTKTGKRVEVILGLNPTKEGEVTSQYLAKKLKELEANITLTRLGRGLPTGGEMVYADKATLKEALERRKEV